MIRCGDETAHTQRGNNNTYNQDNELSWLNWELDDRQSAFLEFVRKMIRLRRKQPVLKRQKFFQGRQIRGNTARDILWLTPLGNEMQDEDWHADSSRVFAVQLNGKMIDEVDDRGRPIRGTTLLVLFNADDDDVEFTLPRLADHEHWRELLDTARPDAPGGRMLAGQKFSLKQRSLAVFGLSAIRPQILAKVFSRIKASAERREARSEKRN